MIGDSVIDSTREVQQGDPCGPSFFSPAIHPILLRARSQTLTSFSNAVDITAFFLDDGVLAGDASAISSFLRDLVTGIALERTEVISASTAFAPSDYPGCTWTATRN